MRNRRVVVQTLVATLVAAGALGRAPAAGAVSPEADAPNCFRHADSANAGQLPAGVAHALAEAGLDRRLWQPEPPLLIVRWGGIDRSHQIVITQAKPSPDGSWAVERIEALHQSRDAPPTLHEAQRRLTPEDGRRLRALLSDECLAAPSPPQGEICLDGQQVVIRARMDGRVRLILQDCSLNDRAIQLEKLVTHDLQPLEFSYGRQGGPRY